MLGGNISDSALFLGHQPWEISHVKPGYIRLQQHQIAFPLKQISELSTPQYSDRLDQLNRSKFKYISFQPGVINMDLSQVEDEIMNNKESQWIKVSLFKLISMFFQHFQSSTYYFQKTKDYHMIRRSRNQAFLTKIQKQFHHRYNFAKYSE